MGTWTRTGWVVAGVALLVGCASQAPPRTAAQLFDCAALNRAVASADRGFADIKGRFDDTRLTRSWKTDVQAFHDACLITSARRPDHYLCFGPLEVSDPRGALMRGGEAVAQCLGEAWESRRTSPDRLEFTRQDAAPVVTLETFLNDRGRRMATLAVFQNAADAAPLPGES